MRISRAPVVFATILVLALMAVGTVSAVNLVDVDATCDVSINYNISGTLNAGETTIANLKLPTTLSNINSAGSGSLTIFAGANTTKVNVVVNGVTVASGYTILGGTSRSWTLTDFSNAGVNLNTADLSIVVSVIANSTSAVWFNASADDAVCSGAYFNVEVTEKQTSTPKLEYYDTDSFYTVKQTVNVTQTSDFNITDVNLTFTYPSNAISHDVTNVVVATLNKSESYVKDLYFQKRGPYVSDIDSDEGDDTYTTEITIYAPEAVTAELTVYPFEYPWYRYFPYFDFSKIKVIELNDKDLDWDSEDNALVLGEEQLDAGNNVLNITYYKPTGPIIIPTPSPTEPQFLGLSVWMWVAIIAVVVVAVVAYKLGSRR